MQPPNELRHGEQVVRPRQPLEHRLDEGFDRAQEPALAAVVGRDQRAERVQAVEQPLVGRVRHQWGRLGARGQQGGSRCHVEVPGDDQVGLQALQRGAYLAAALAVVEVPAHHAPYCLRNCQGTPRTHMFLHGGTRLCANGDFLPARGAEGYLSEWAPRAKGAPK